MAHGTPRLRTGVGSCREPRHLVPPFCLLPQLELDVSARPDKQPPRMNQQFQVPSYASHPPSRLHRARMAPSLMRTFQRIHPAVVCLGIQLPRRATATSSRVARDYSFTRAPYVPEIRGFRRHTGSHPKSRILSDGDILRASELGLVPRLGRQRSPPLLISTRFRPPLAPSSHTRSAQSSFPGRTALPPRKSRRACRASLRTSGVAQGPPAI